MTLTVYARSFCCFDMVYGRLGDLIGHISPPYHRLQEFFHESYGFPSEEAAFTTNWPSPRVSFWLGGNGRQLDTAFHQKCPQQRNGTAFCRFIIHRPFHQQVSIHRRGCKGNVDHICTIGYFQGDLRSGCVESAALRIPAEESTSTTRRSVCRELVAFCAQHKPLHCQRQNSCGSA